MDRKRRGSQVVEAGFKGSQRLGVVTLGNGFGENVGNNIHKCKNILKYLFEISNELLSLHLQIICPYFR